MQTAKIIAASTRAFVESPYNADLVSEIKDIPGRRWHPVEKCWSVPAEAEQGLREIVRKYFQIEGEEVKIEIEVLRLKVTGKSSAKRSYCGGVTIDGHDLISTMNGQLRKSPNFEILKSEGGFVYGDGYINPKRGSSHAFKVEYIVEVRVRKDAKIEATGHAEYWGSVEILGRIDESAEDAGSSTAVKPRKVRKAKGLRPDLAALQLPKGFTVRKASNALKVVKVKESKQFAEAA